MKAPPTEHLPPSSSLPPLVPSFLHPSLLPAVSWHSSSSGGGRPRQLRGHAAAAGTPQLVSIGTREEEEEHPLGASVFFSGFFCCFQINKTLMATRAPPAGGSVDLKVKKQRHKPVRPGSVRKANVMKCRLLEEKKG